MLKKTNEPSDLDVRVIAHAATSGRVDMEKVARAWAAANDVRMIDYIYHASKLIPDYLKLDRETKTKTNTLVHTSYDDNRVETGKRIVSKDIVITVYYYVLTPQGEALLNARLPDWRKAGGEPDATAE